MRTHGQTTVWNHHNTVSWGKPRTAWFQQLYNWWMLYTATRRDKKLAALSGCWDAHGEVFKAVRAESAAEMAASNGALSVATQLYGLSV
jgi:hypothetical protein